MRTLIARIQDFFFIEQRYIAAKAPRPGRPALNKADMDKLAAKAERAMPALKRFEERLSRLQAR
jgi:hypothetical protein